MLFGKNLVEELDRVYGKLSRFVVMFVSKAYADKPWTTHERRSAMTAALQRKADVILPIRLDDTQLDGLNPRYLLYKWKNANTIRYLQHNHPHTNA